MPQSTPTLRQQLKLVLSGLLAAILSIFLMPAAVPAVADSPGTVVGSLIIAHDTTWDDEGSPYTIAGKVQVAAGATLTIEPGVDVYLQVPLELEGTLSAVGTPSTPVTIRNDTGLAKAIGALSEPTRQLVLGHAVIQGPGPLLARSGVDIRVNIHDSKLSDITTPNYFWYPDSLVIERNVFTNVAPLEVLSRLTDAVIRHNRFRSLPVNLQGAYNGRSQIINLAAYEQPLRVEGNVFEPSVRPFMLELSAGYTGAAIDASGNYFGTTDTTKVEEWILDRSDDLNRASVINVVPLLDSPPSEVPLAEPTRPRAIQSESSDQEVAITWEAPDSDGGAPITGYRISTSPSGASTTVASDTLSATFQDLQRDIHHTFSIQAVNEVGESAPTETGVYVPPVEPTEEPSEEPVVPDYDAPALVDFDFTPKAVDVTSAQATIEVTARITDANGVQTPIVSVSSDRSTQTLGFGPMTLVSGTSKDGIYSRVVTVPRTAADGEWTVSIYPLTDAIGNGDLTFHRHPQKLSVTNLSGLTVPSAPRAVAAMPGAAPMVSWGPPTSDGGTPIEEYKIVATPGGKTVTVDGATSQVRVEGLTSGTTYTFTVFAINKIGTGPASAASTPVTVPSQPTEPPLQTPSPEPSASSGPTQAPSSPSRPAPSKPSTAKPFDLYTSPGYHDINGRRWHTSCEQYSSTVTRCTTTIWATQVHESGGQFVQSNGWVFNNLTYAASPRSTWKNNPLAANGVVGGKVSWTAADGRKWRTECDTATTGRNGCRSFIQARVIESYTTSNGTRQFRWVTKEIFNNMVRFK